MDELNDRELDSILREWKAPDAPVQLREKVFPKSSAPWWRKLWQASFRIPVPVACLLGAILILIAWRVSTVAPRIIVHTERIEVPVVRTEVVYRDRIVVPKPADNELRPVAELRPIIIRSRNDQN